MHLISEQANSSFFASRSTKPCTILRIPRQRSHSSATVCSCSDLLLPNHFRWACHHFHMPPQQSAGVHCPQTQTSLQPPKHHWRLKNRGEFQGKTELNLPALTVITSLSGGPGLVDSLLYSPQPAALLWEPVSVQMRVWFLLNLPPVFSAQTFLFP